MIRNLFASAILMAASTAVFAAGNIADSLDAEGAISSDVIGAALAQCANTDCKADVLIEAIEANVDAASVMSIALAADIDANTIASALRSANVSESDIFAAAIANNQNPEKFTEVTASGNTTINAPITRNRIPAASVPNGISPTLSDQRAPVTDFDIPGISIGADNSIQFD